MSSHIASADESLTRLLHSSEESFFSQLKTLEDFLASHNHTLESALQLAFSNKDKDSVIEEKADEISRRARELYQYRDFLLDQRHQSEQPIQTNLSPIRMRRLARV